ncbi:hypothetical protein Halar_1116 [halophilic archaeon DL31]|jgi:hypothetical protein|nr:hypothetical protein Halar_1116 [halophilic archaeon DL31]
MTEYGCKVCQVLDERDLKEMNPELVARWTGEGGKRLGYRRLADWLNTALLRREMEIVGMPTGGDEARSRYERLHDDDTAPAVRRLLKRGGVALDDLGDDFVSYSVVRTHLQDCLDASREPSPPSAWEPGQLERLEAYAASEATDAVRSLRNKGQLKAVGEVEAVVTIAVACSVCGTSVPVADALAAKRFCECTD